MTEAIRRGEPLTDIPLALQIDYFRVGADQLFRSGVHQGSGLGRGTGGEGRRRVHAISTSWARFRTSSMPSRATCGTTSASSWTPTKAAKISGRKSFQYDAGFTLAPGRYRMKFLVRENVSGKMGTFETQFTIPDLSADTSASEAEQRDLEQPARAVLKPRSGLPRTFLEKGSVGESAGGRRARK